MSLAQWLLKIKPTIDISAKYNHAFNQACKVYKLVVCSSIFYYDSKNV